MSLQSELKEIYPRSKNITPDKPSKPVRVHPTATITLSGEYYTVSLASNGNVVRGRSLDQAEALYRARALHQSRKFITEKNLCQT